MENNQVKLLGFVTSDFSFSHEFYGEKFFQVNISVERNSGTMDSIPVIVSERLIDVSRSYVNRFIYVEGQFRSHNLFDGDRKRLILFVFASDIYLTDEETPMNRIYLEGYVCKEPVHRSTPFGREITDFIIAVNRQYGKSDYIPCICWGRTSVFVSSFPVGQYVSIDGRIQSREYQKANETRTAYEVSIIELH